MSQIAFALPDGDGDKNVADEILKVFEKENVPYATLNNQISKGMKRLRAWQVDSEEFHLRVKPHLSSDLLASVHFVN